MAFLNRLTATAGGPAQLRAIVLLSAALALAAGSQTIAGAVAPEVKLSLHIDNTQIGLLITATSVMGAATTLPFGVLADRVGRVRLLAGCALLGSVALLVAGSAQSYEMLLIAQAALGAGIGAATPIVASLTGDLFPTADRGRVYGLILAGEFAGASSGLLIAGELAAFWSWRVSFWALAIPGPILAVALLRMMPEPARGDMEQQPSPLGETPSDGPARTDDAGQDHDHPTIPGATGLSDLVTRAGIQPRQNQVLSEDPTRKSLAWALRYVLSIRTNVALIIASALAYYYVAGMQAFIIVFFRGRFDMGQSTATLLLVLVGVAVVSGTLISGPLSDRLIARGRIAARPMIGGIACLVAAAFAVPGFLLTSLVWSFPLLFLCAAAIGGTNPPLDAARLDIMHSRLWGRAESVRNFLQTLLKSSAPLVFGYLSTLLNPTGGNTDQVQGGGAVGLDRAFLAMLVVLVIAGIILLVAARRTYPRDVATAIASEKATRHG